MYFLVLFGLLDVVGGWVFVDVVVGGKGLFGWVGGCKCYDVVNFYECV